MQPRRGTPGRSRADVAQLVEHHLAKVRVAGSNPVVRSEARCHRQLAGLAGTSLVVEWPRGEAAACKAVYVGSNPISTSHQRAIGAAVARFPDTEEVTGSIPVSPTSAPKAVPRRLGTASSCSSNGLSTQTATPTSVSRSPADGTGQGRFGTEPERPSRPPRFAVSPSGCPTASPWRPGQRRWTCARRRGRERGCLHDPCMAETALMLTTASSHAVAGGLARGVENHAGQPGLVRRTGHVSHHTGGSIGRPVSVAKRTPGRPTPGLRPFARPPGWSSGPGASSPPPRQCGLRRGHEELALDAARACRGQTGGRPHTSSREGLFPMLPETISVDIHAL